VANGYFLTLPNDEMYKLAEQTASYKKRGITDDQVLAEILAAFKDHVIPFETIYVEAKKSAKIMNIYERMNTMRETIRNDVRNTIVL
jgi:hypothetical protein